MNPWTIIGWLIVVIGCLMLPGVLLHYARFVRRPVAGSLAEFAQAVHRRRQAGMAFSLHTQEAIVNGGRGLVAITMIVPGHPSLWVEYRPAAPVPVPDDIVKLVRGERHG